MFFYNLFIRLLISAMRIGAIFNYKLKKGLAGRRQSCDNVRQKFSPEDKVIWMHAASLGEYEQGARAGAALVADGVYAYIINGELKPGIRTNEINRIKENRK